MHYALCNLIGEWLSSQSIYRNMIWGYVDTSLSTPNMEHVPSFGDIGDTQSMSICFNPHSSNVTEVSLYIRKIAFSLHSQNRIFFWSECSGSNGVSLWALDDTQWHPMHCVARKSKSARPRPRRSRNWRRIWRSSLQKRIRKLPMSERDTNWFSPRQRNSWLLSVRMKLLTYWKWNQMLNWLWPNCIRKEMCDWVRFVAVALPKRIRLRLKRKPMSRPRRPTQKRRSLRTMRNLCHCNRRLRSLQRNSWGQRGSMKRKWGRYNLWGYVHFVFFPMMTFTVILTVDVTLASK